MIKLFILRIKKKGIYIMQEKLKEIIDSYPEFSRETVFNIVSEFNANKIKKKFLKVLQLLGLIKFISLKKLPENIN